VSASADNAPSILTGFLMNPPRAAATADDRRCGVD
jgi:hypothetical protein